MWFDGCARLVANRSYNCALISKEQCQSFQNAEEGYGIGGNLANYVIGPSESSLSELAEALQPRLHK
jgi:hypothetical protein